MRLVIAQMKHETNTFSPVPTPLARFARGRGAPLEGARSAPHSGALAPRIGAFIELAEQAGAEVVLPVAGNAAPSGPVQTAAYEYMAQRILDAVAKGCDAVLLDLHGAMVTRSYDDGEGELLGRIRKIAPEVPIGVALDMHTNLFPAMGGWPRRSPATRPIRTWTCTRRACAPRPILARWQGKPKPAMAWGSGRCCRT